MHPDDVTRAVANLASRAPTPTFDAASIRADGRRRVARRRATLTSTAVAVVALVVVGSLIVSNLGRARDTARSPKRSETSPSVVDTTAQDVGIAVASASTAWKCLSPLQSTDDGGRTWRVVTVPTDASPALDGSPVCTALPDGNVWSAQAISRRVSVLHVGPGASRRSERVSRFELSGVATVVQSITFIDPLDGWLAATDETFTTARPHQDLYETRNGGDTWELVDSDVRLDGFQFTSPTRGWALASVDELETTTDGGHTWRAVALPAAPQETFIGQFAAEPAAVVLWLGAIIGNTARPLFDVSVDAGRTWTRRSGPPGAGLTGPFGFAAIGAMHWRFLAGQLWITDDGGHTWTQRPQLPVGVVASMSFPTPDIGWLSGSAGAASSPVLLRTRDAGRTWTDLTSARPVDQPAKAGGIIGCPTQPITAAPAGDPPPGLLPTALAYAAAGSLWSDASVDAVYRVGNLNGGMFSEAIANDVSTCGVDAARNAWVVELHHPSGAQLSAVVLAHYADGWHAFGSYA